MLTSLPYSTRLCEVPPANQLTVHHPYTRCCINHIQPLECILFVLIRLATDRHSALSNKDSAARASSVQIITESCGNETQPRIMTGIISIEQFVRNLRNTHAAFHYFFPCSNSSDELLDIIC